MYALTSHAHAHVTPLVDDAIPEQIQRTSWIAVLDFGSQYTHLIARSLRDAGTYSEIVDGEITWLKLIRTGAGSPPAGIVLSGSPSSALEPQAPVVDTSILDVGVPILGVCYGFQMLTQILGGEVTRAASTGRGEFGRSSITIDSASVLLGTRETVTDVWMSHSDEVTTTAPEWTVVARSSGGSIAAAEDSARNRFGLQFHPEVHHTEIGQEILERWAIACGCEPSWTLADVRADLISDIRAKAGDRHVISFVSGGVDSTVATVLAVKALGPDRVHPVHVDNGLLREGESDLVCAALTSIGIPVNRVDAADRFYDALRGVTDPELKRFAIGDIFIQIQQEVTARLGLSPDTLLCQGTLYPDLVESGFGVGNRSATMISHHNVGTPLVRAKREQGLLVEPLSRLYKDEVRTLGVALGIEQRMLDRFPFPGPGLALRILGEVNADRCIKLRQIDRVVLDEVQRSQIPEAELWQVFAVLTGANAVGVHGDARSYGEVVAIRAVTSRDGMTADCYRFEWDDLLRISARITEESADVSKVVYDISSKPPSNIEWE